MHSAPLTFPFRAACIPAHSNYLEIIVLIEPFKQATIKKGFWVANFFASIFQIPVGPGGIRQYPGQKEKRVSNTVYRGRERLSC